MTEILLVSTIVLLSIMWGFILAAGLEASGALERWTMTEKPLPKRNPVAEALAEAKNKPKTVPSKKVYNRKNKTVDIDEE